MNLQQAWQDLQELPPQMQQEVIDFVAILRAKADANRAPYQAPSRSFTDESFFGAWKDRTDIEDSAEFVRELREREWRRYER